MRIIITRQEDHRTCTVVVHTIYYKNQGKKAHTIQGWDESPKDFKYQKRHITSLNKSKFTSSVGAVTLDAVKKYIEDQKK